jgi:hypothetical protein
MTSTFILPPKFHPDAVNVLFELERGIDWSQLVLLLMCREAPGALYCGLGTAGGKAALLLFFLAKHDIDPTRDYSNISILIYSYAMWAYKVKNTRNQFALYNQYVRKIGC